MKKILCFLIMAFVFISCDNKANDDEFKGYKVGDEISLKSFDNKSITLLRAKNGFVIKGDEDKIIIFDLFGTFCPPCQTEAPYLSALQNELKDKIIIIGLAYFEKKDNLKLENFAKVYGASYFMTNDINGDNLTQAILDDINYPDAVLLPLKVVLKNGEYQALRDGKGVKTQNKFYLGAIKTEFVKQDIQELINH